MPRWWASGCVSIRETTASARSISRPAVRGIPHFQPGASTERPPRIGFPRRWGHARAELHGDFAHRRQSIWIHRRRIPAILSAARRSWRGLARGELCFPADGRGNDSAGTHRVDRIRSRAAAMAARFHAAVLCRYRIAGIQRLGAYGRRSTARARVITRAPWGTIFPPLATWSYFTCMLGGLFSPACY